MVVLVQLGVFLAVLVRWPVIYPVLAVNLLFSGAILFLVVPPLPQEVSYIFSYWPFVVYAPSDLLDYKYMILTAIEVVVLVPSLFAVFGMRWAITLAWIGFAANFVLSVFALWFAFAFTFEFKCCGYL